MSAARTWAVTLRIVRQFRRDLRTLVLLFAVPTIVILLVGYLLRTSSGGIRLGLVDETGGAAAPPSSRSARPCPGPASPRTTCRGPRRRQR